MSLSSALRKATFAVPLVFALAANANAAELACYTNAADIEALKTQVFKKEGMVPFESHYENVGTDANPSWIVSTMVTNTQTKKGYEWFKNDQGSVCIAKKYSEVEIHNYEKFDAGALVEVKGGKYPSANDVGDGKNISTVGINALLLVHEAKSRNPMYSAKVDARLSTPSGLPNSYYEVFVGNPANGEGNVLAAGFNGKAIPQYMTVVGTPQRDGVKYGAIYTPAGEEMVGRRRSVAAVSLDRR